jgi:lysozyme
MEAEMGWLDMAMDLAKQFEGCELEAYPDPAHGWSIPTIGYGCTGPGIKKGTIWTQQQADDELAQRMANFGAAVDRLVSVSLTDEQKAALSDFAYNLGHIALQNSTLLSLLNAGNVTAAAGEFPKWIKAGGIVLPGLVKRRAAERALFLLGSNLQGDQS